MRLRRDSTSAKTWRRLTPVPLLQRPPAAPEEIVAPPGTLGRRLLDQGLLGPDDLGFILSWQRSLDCEWPVRRIGSLLVKAGLLTVRQVADALGAQRGVPVMTELPRFVPPWLQQVFPRELLQKHGAVPLYVTGRTLVLGMVEPERQTALQALQAHTRYVVESVRALEIQVHRLIRSIYLRVPGDPPLPI